MKEVILIIADLYTIPIGLTFSTILVYIIARFALFKLINSHSKSGKIVISRVVYVRKFINLLLITLTLLFLGAIWEISFKGLSIYFVSVFTIIGVALFATWSVLSNLTSSIILFFFFPYRIGQQIKIIDGDNSQEGQIIDLTLFYVKIETPNKQIIAYPNSLAIQKPILLSNV